MPRKATNVPLSFKQAARLPRFIARELPFRRRVFVPESGPERGRALHFVDEGPRDGPVVWLQHGNPTWSYLYRKVIQDLDTTRYRVIAPDLYGFGLSAKHFSLGDHSLTRHVDALEALLKALDPADIFFVGQDWGGPMVTGLGARQAQRVRGVVLMNTSVLVPTRPLGTAFHRFARVPVISDLVFRLGGLPQRVLWAVQGDRRSIRGPVSRAYQWPFRKVWERDGPLALARMVPDSIEHPSVEPLRRSEEWIRGFDGPVELVWGMRDPILARALRRHERALPSARVTRTEAGHFLQEEVPLTIAEALYRVTRAVEV